MPNESLSRFVRNVVIETLIVAGAIAGILAFLYPLVGLSWALALIAFVVLVAIIVALVIRPRSSQAPAPAVAAPNPSAKAPAEARRTERPSSSGQYYIPRNGMLFVVEMTERPSPSKEPLVEIVGLPLCPNCQARMVKTGDDTDWLGAILRRSWKCPNGDSSGYTSYVPPEETLELVKALAVGRWHNGDPFDPPFREQPRPPVSKPQAANQPAAPRRATFLTPSPAKPQASAGPLARAYVNARSDQQPNVRPVPDTGMQVPPSSQPRAREEQIAAGTVIEVRDVVSMRLPLRKSDRLYGHLREKDDLEFTWGVVDLKNLGLAERGGEYDYEEGEEDVPSAIVEWTAPSDGPWFLMFDAYQKKYVRRIVVELWRRSPV